MRLRRPRPFPAEYLKACQRHPDTCRRHLAHHLALNRAYDGGARTVAEMVESANRILVGSDFPPLDAPMLGDDSTLCSECLAVLRDTM